MKPEDPTANGRIPEKPKGPVDADVRSPPAMPSAAAAKQPLPAKPAQARKRKKPFVL
jgi:hypothetical protein